MPLDRPLTIFMPLCIILSSSQLIGDALKADGPNLVKKTKGIIQFNITPNGAWNLDLKNGSGSLTKGEKKADLTVTVSDEDFFNIATGKLNPQQVRIRLPTQARIGCFHGFDSWCKPHAYE